MRKQVLILAGGLGTRLRPITEQCPKPMVQVCGEPFLHWQILDLKEQGYTDIILLVAYLGEQIRNHFGDGSKWGIKIDYVFETSPLGTGGAIRHAIDVMKDDIEDDFIVVNGDSFLRAPLDEIAGFFEETQFEAVVTTFDNGLKTGLPATPVPNNLKVKNRIVIDYQKAGGLEKGFEFVDSGIYFFKKSVFMNDLSMPLTGLATLPLDQILSPLIAKRTFGAFPVDVRFFDIGTVERLKEFEEYVRQERLEGRLHGRDIEGVP